MSIWTHVNGNIRLDEFGTHNSSHVKSIIGKMYTYNPEKYKLPLEDFSNNSNEITLPYGSEGSILYSVTTNGDFSSLSAYSISLWGDLRDYDTDTVRGEMIPWFKKLLKDFHSNHLLIRSAVLELEIEDGNHIILLGSEEFNEDTNQYEPKVSILNVKDFIK